MLELGEHIEMQAVSDIFNTNIYVCSQNRTNIVRWEKKATPKRHKVSITSLSTLPNLHMLFTIQHAELSFDKYHYKCYTSF